MQAVGFDDAFTFKFSPRDGTPATRMPEEWTVPDAVSAERLGRLIEAVRAGARARNLRMLGERREVLVEKPAKRGELLQARWRDYKTVLLPRRRVVGRALPDRRTHGHDWLDVHGDGGAGALPLPVAS